MSNKPPLEEGGPQMLNSDTESYTGVIVSVVVGLSVLAYLIVWGVLTAL